MRILIGVFFIILLLLNKLSAQEDSVSDYFRFAARVGTIPSNLNNHLFDTLTFFGISDPFIDSTKAVEQAIKRATSLAAMANGICVKSYTTGYYSEGYVNEAGTYQSMVSITPKQHIAPSVIVLDTVFTELNEAIVRVKKQKSKKQSRNFDFELVKYNEEYIWEGIPEYNEQIEMKIKDGTVFQEKLVYVKHTNKEEAYCENDEQTETHPLTKYLYVYENGGEAHVFKYGLWINILRELCLQLEQRSKMFKEKVRQMDENFDLSDKIDEGVSKNSFNFYLKSVRFEKNDIVLDIDLQFID